MLSKNLNTKRIWNNSPCYGVLALVLGLMLVEWLRGAPVPSCLPQDFQSFQNKAIELILSKTFQSVVVGNLFFYHLLLLWLNGRGRNQDFGIKRQWWRALDASDWCKLFLVLCAVWRYMVEWKIIPDSGDKDLFLFGIDQSTNVLVFLAGIVLGQFVEMLVPRYAQVRFSFARVSLITLVMFLAVASLAQNKWAFQFRYRDEIRTTGLWNNPNTYGLLMGIGLVLALAYLTQGTGLVRRNQLGKPSDKDSDLQYGERRRRISLGSVCVVGIATILLTTGLFHSFSRGAWLATLAGCAFVFSNAHMADRGKLTSWFELKGIAGLAWLRREKWLLIIAGCSIITLILTCQPYMHHRLTRRATSVVNANDFSMRYRLIAYKGALQIMADHPITGVGWHRVGPRFEYFYAPSILAESRSIILNDYMTTGMALGIPALICFIGLVWISWNGFARAHNGLGSANWHLTNQKAGHHESRSKSWLEQAYRGALIVLLIGFWFDGGLFKLVLAVPFWLFLELSNQPLIKVNERE